MHQKYMAFRTEDITMQEPWERLYRSYREEFYEVTVQGNHLVQNNMNRDITKTEARIIMTACVWL